MILMIMLMIGCQEKEEHVETQYGFPSEYGGYYVKYSSSPDPIPFNEEFNIEITAYAAENPTDTLTDFTIEVDAQMPEHNHGMNQRPNVTMEEGLALAEGMLFHMTGYWEIVILINQENKRETVYLPVDCCE